MSSVRPAGTIVAGRCVLSKKSDRATVAVDAMGGDHAPSAIVEGAALAARRGIPIALVGPIDQLRRELARQAADRLPIECIHAAEAIAMDESPLAALRRKPTASVKVAAETVAAGAAQALFSAGHTGATFL